MQDVEVAARCARTWTVTMGVLLALVLSVVAPAGSLTAASAQTTPPPRNPDVSPAYMAAVDLTFPVYGTYRFRDDYHDCRDACARIHRATDVMAATGTPVHAAVGGVITQITGLTGPPPAAGYYLSILGDDGRTYRYLHLGTQAGPPSDAYAVGMQRGTRVVRGQHIGYVGWSGNAREVAPHLHFEIIDARITDPYGTNRMNPFASLRAAEQRGDFPRWCDGPAYALAGDWAGAGRDQPGWWCDGMVRLRTPNGSVTAFTYGRRGDVPVVADWNGDGRDTVSIIRDGTWHVNLELAGGPSARTFDYGRVVRGDVPIAGAWRAAGADMPGIIRDRSWQLRFTQAGGSADLAFEYGRLTRGDLPLVGDWDGDGLDGVGIVRDGVWHLRDELSAGPAPAPFRYGRVLAGDRPVVGDWTGDGRATPGIVRRNVWHLREQNAAGIADRVVLFPQP